jgi:hypothetical protein
MALNGSPVPDGNEGSIYGTAFTGGETGAIYGFSIGQTVARRRAYDMIRSKGSASSVDDGHRCVCSPTSKIVGAVSNVFRGFHVSCQILSP